MQVSAGPGGSNPRKLQLVSCLLLRALGGVPWGQTGRQAGLRPSKPAALQTPCCLLPLPLLLLLHLAQTRRCHRLWAPRNQRLKQNRRGRVG